MAGHPHGPGRRGVGSAAAGAALCELDEVAPVDELDVVATGQVPGSEREVGGCDEDGPGGTVVDERHADHALDLRRADVVSGRVAFALHDHRLAGAAAAHDVRAQVARAADDLHPSIAEAAQEGGGSRWSTRAATASIGEG